MRGSERSKNLGTFEFNPYAAGAKTYGMVGRSPNMGPVDQSGYAGRDRRLAARKNAVLKRMQSMNKGTYGSSDALRFMN